MKKQIPFVTIIIFLHSFLCAGQIIPNNTLVKTSSKTNRLIETDFNQSEGSKSSIYNFCVGAGRAHEGLRADWQRQFSETIKDIGFRYIRFHGLLCDEMAVYSEDAAGKPVYNFQYIDKLFDFLLSNHVRPFVELGFMPTKLASTDKTIFWWKGNVSNPKDYEKWGLLIEKLAEHLIARYGEDEVAKWYFEVWNEPNLKSFSQNGDINDYFKLYESAAKAIKRVSPELRVGGPSATEHNWISEMITYCKSNNVPLDFLSSHTYGVNDGGFLDEFGTRNVITNANPNLIPDGVKATREKINKTAYKNSELHYTEWSSSYTSRDPIHDTYLNAAYVLNVLRNVEHGATSMSYWTFTDIFEEIGPVTKPIHGGFGLLTVHDIKKPTYFAYKFLNELGATELKTNDPSSWVCKDEKGNVQILAYDLSMSKQDKIANQVFYRKKIVAEEKGALTIKIKNVPNGKYLLVEYKVGFQQNDMFSTYFDLGLPDELSINQEDTLRKSATGEPAESRIIEINDNSFVYSGQIKENDIRFLKLFKISN